MHKYGFALVVATPQSQLGGIIVNMNASLSNYGKGLSFFLNTTKGLLLIEKTKKLHTTRHVNFPGVQRWLGREGEIELLIGRKVFLLSSTDQDATINTKVVFLKPNVKIIGRFWVQFLPFIRKRNKNDVPKVQTKT